MLRAKLEVGEVFTQRRHLKGSRSSVELNENNPACQDKQGHFQTYLSFVFLISVLFNVIFDIYLAFRQLNTVKLNINIRSRTFYSYVYELMHVWAVGSAVNYQFILIRTIKLPHNNSWIHLNDLLPLMTCNSVAAIKMQCILQFTVWSTATKHPCGVQNVCFMYY